MKNRLLLSIFSNLTSPNYLSTCVSGYHKEVENVSGYIIGR